MPVRVNPVQHFGPCILTLASLKGICDRVLVDFPSAKFNGTDGVWEIFDEGMDVFIDEVSRRERLDSFTVKASNSSKRSSLKIIFDGQIAQVTLQDGSDAMYWFEHFLIDIRSHLLKPSLRQSLSRPMTGESANFEYSLPGLAMVPFFLFGALSSTSRHCTIVIKENPPSPRVENIKANLISNVIWLILGVVLALISGWILSEFGIDINPLN